MTRFVRLCWCSLLLLGSCGMPDDAAPPEMTEPVRIETTAATFIVRDAVAEDFQKLLAGEPTQHEYYAGDDAP